MIANEKYQFSFTAGSLMVNEMAMVADALVKKEEFNFVEILGKGKTATGRRYCDELVKRIKNLASDEVDLLINGDLYTQKQMCFLSVCKTYGFIKDFTVEVLRNKILVYDYEITDGDYISFIRSKMIDHEELEKISELTQKKIKQVLFKIYDQAGIIDNIKNKMIQPQFLEPKVQNIIMNDNPNWLKIFFMSDLDIQSVKP